MLQAVAFDLDGTLYPYTSVILRAIPYFLSHLRLTVQFSKVRKRLRKERPISDFYVRQSEMLADFMGISAGESSKIIQTLIYGSWGDVLRGVKPFPAVKETLLDLKNRNLKLGVLSDFPVVDKLRILGLEGMWDYTNSSESVGYLKPNPEPFYHLAASLDIEPELIMFIGDDYTLDIEGASRIGMKTAHFSRRPAAASKADITFSDYTRLINHLEMANLL